jgi:hypothetical protein
VAELKLEEVEVKAGDPLDPSGLSKMWITAAYYAWRVGIAPSNVNLVVRGSVLEMSPIKVVNVFYGATWEDGDWRIKTTT